MSKSGHQTCASTYVNDKFWEISGYPNGLAGEAIPQAGRIVAIRERFAKPEAV